MRCTWIGIVEFREFCKAKRLTRVGYLQLRCTPLLEVALEMYIVWYENELFSNLKSFLSLVNATYA